MSAPKNRRMIPMLVLLICLFSFQIKGSTPAKHKQSNKLFSIAPDDAPQSLDVVDAVYMKIESATLQQIYSQKSETLELQIPTGGSTSINLELTRKNFLTENFVVTQRTASGASPYTYQPGVYYQGTVVGKPNSLVAISFFDDKVMAVLSFDNDDYNLGISTNAALVDDDVYVFYPESNLLVGNDFHCHTSADDVEVPADLITTGNTFTTTNNSVKMYMECDYLMFQDNNSDVAETTDFVTNMFNVVSAVYDIDDICMELNEVFVWATQDPYPTSASDAALDAFQNQLNGNFNGDLAHLLSTSNMGNGGLAYVDVLCNSNVGIAYSNIDDSYSNLPNFSWTVEVVTHEIGHNLGSPHTHSCSWPTGPIDNCFCPEGSCSPGPDPGTAGGTIMSYCHLTGSSTYGSCEIPGFPNPGIDLNLGFGTQPAALIYNNIESSSCLTACGESGGGGGGGSALDCGQAVELFSGVTYNGNTDNGVANISNYGCVNYDESGNEVVHFFTAPVSGTAQIDYNENVDGYIDLFVLSACNPNNCLMYFDGAVGVSETMDVIAGQTYYFITDVYLGGNGGAYDLTITFPDGACQCDNPLALQCDNLEPYNVGALGPQSICWTTWSGTEGGVEDGIVNTEQAASGTHALKMEGTANGGPQDVVFLTGNYTAGHYELSFKIFVPVGKAAYYNLMHVFEQGSSYQWASEVFFNADGSGSLNAGGVGVANFNYTQGTWVDVVQVINMDNDETTLTIDGAMVETWPFSYQADNVADGVMALAAVDFYPIDETYQYWIDDIELVEVSVTPILAISPNNHNVNESAGNVDFSINSNITWSITDNAAWLTLSSAGATGTQMLTASYDENTATTSRVATITLTGSGITQTVTVTQAGANPPPPPIVQSSSIVNESCFGASDGAINLTVSGGVPGFTYNWSNGMTSQNISGLTGGNYSCTITDAVGQTMMTGSLTVNAAPQLTIQIQSPGTLNCNQLNLVIDASTSTSGTGVSANWTTIGGNIISGANALTPLIDAPGTYTLTLTYNNNNNCAETSSVNVVEVPAMDATVSATPATGSNNDGSAIVNVTGGTPPYQYLWNTTPAQTTQVATNLAAGSYSVAISDTDDCTLVTTVMVDELTNINTIEGLNAFDLFPNPSEGQVMLSVDVEQALPMSVRIFDVLGTVVWESNYNNKTISQEIDLAALSNAIYFVQLNVEGASLTKKLLINK